LEVNRAAEADQAQDGDYGDENNGHHTNDIGEICDQVHHIKHHNLRPPSILTFIVNTGAVLTSYKPNKTLRQETCKEWGARQIINRWNLEDMHR